MPNPARTLTTISLAALFGGMVFFAIIMAPLVFTQLPPATAGTFIRATFPFYYVYLITTAALATIGFLLRRQPAAAIAAAIIIATTTWLWFGLLPHLDALRAAHNTAAFTRGHHLSVYVNAAQLIITLTLLITSP